MTDIRILPGLHAAVDFFTQVVQAADSRLMQSVSVSRVLRQHTCCGAVVAQQWQVGTQVRRRDARPEVRHHDTCVQKIAFENPCVSNLPEV